MASLTAPWLATTQPGRALAHSPGSANGMSLRLQRRKRRGRPHGRTAHRERNRIWQPVPIIQTDASPEAVNISTTGPRSEDAAWRRPRPNDRPSGNAGTDQLSRLPGNRLPAGAALGHAPGFRNPAGQQECADMAVGDDEPHLRSVEDDSRGCIRDPRRPRLRWCSRHLRMQSRSPRRSLRKRGRVVGSGGRSSMIPWPLRACPSRPSTPRERRRCSHGRQWNFLWPYG